MARKTKIDAMRLLNTALNLYTVNKMDFRPEQTFADAVSEGGLDSLDQVEAIMQLEEDFEVEIGDAEVDEWMSMTLEQIAERLEAKQADAPSGEESEFA